MSTSINLSIGATGSPESPAASGAAVAGASVTDIDGMSLSDWDGLTALVDHLEATHHVYLRAVLPGLVALANKVAGVHSDTQPELVRVATLVEALQAELLPHMMKEERMLFPMIRELTAATQVPSFHCGSLMNPIRVMGVDHDNVISLFSELRHITSQYTLPEGACGSYQALFKGLVELEADTDVHTHKEDNLLFPAVLAAESALVANQNPVS